MAYAVLASIDEALDEYAELLPDTSLTFLSIVREDPWGDTAAYARSEGYTKLAILLEKAEAACYRHEMAPRIAS